MTTNIPIEENDQTRARREHLERLRELVGNVYPNRFARSSVTGAEDTITSIVEQFSALAPQVKEGARPAPEELERANAALNPTRVRLAGRIATPPRVMGKAAFVHLSDGVSRLQIYVRRDDVAGVRNDESDTAVDGWQLLGLLDHGDFIGVEGFLFVTKTGELSVHVGRLQFLAKALLPMPDKMHGIADPEIRQRQRYADLIAGSLKLEREEGELTTREVFERRFKLIREMRRYLDEHGYVEVETPMLSPIASGAAARPFKTHHNALDIDLYLRIAPELYLKRLVVGGFEKVYELNRNFRNEGIGYRWNPEFTMLEFYCAYMNADGMMDFCEEMLRTAVERVTGDTRARYGGHEIDFAPRFERLSMKEAIDNNWPRGRPAGESWSVDFSEMTRGSYHRDWLDNPHQVRYLAACFADPLNIGYFLPNLGVPRISGGQLELVLPARENPDTAEIITQRFIEKLNQEFKEPEEVQTTRLIVKIFETIAESQLIQPTFIVDFPQLISPLSKASPADPSIAERFELYMGGMEVANGFSELNDPVEQYERFLEQMEQRERGDEEAMPLDEDYVRALAYGMPPAAGIGIGVDRVAMILTNRRSIRDVILFPHMRPRKAAESGAETTEEG